MISSLAAAHREGVLHRDIKPSNVVLTRDDQPKLIDFGIAKLVEATDQLPTSQPATGSPESNDDESNDGESDDGESDDGASVGLTREGEVLGTSYYLAPELWCGQPATRESDVYSLGVVLYELCSGRVPHDDVPESQLPVTVAARDAVGLAARVPDVEPGLAEIVDRCLRRDPQARFPSGEALRNTLEALYWEQRPSLVPHGNPYRGLRRFEARHRALFFGRDADVRTLVERMQRERIVLVAGESGVGKSSVIRAGVIPFIEQHGLQNAQTWRTRLLSPGKHPLTTIADALAEHLDADEMALTDELRDQPMHTAERLRRLHRTDGGLVLFIDQFEELVTLGDPEQSLRAARALAHLVERVRSIRLVATLRADKIADLASLPGLGSWVEHALYMLRPLTPQAIREVILSPARAKGFRFESDAMIQKLIETTTRAKAGLPLLQFALAQMWSKRDVATRTILASALPEIGGVEGALARHADHVLTSLLPTTRTVVRQIFMQLVTVHRTRTHCTEGQIVASNPSRRTVLDTLCTQRLIVARELEGATIYEIAHEALLTNWPTLRYWIEDEGNMRAVKERLVTAAEDWHQQGRPRDALWRGQILQQARDIDGIELSDRDATFLAASRTADRRTRLLRWLLLVGFAVLSSAIYAGVKYQEARERARHVDSQVRRAETVIDAARAAYERLDSARERAFEAFRDVDQTPGFEEISDAARRRGMDYWQRAIALEPEVENQYIRATAELERAFLRDVSRTDVRARLVAILQERATLAYQLGRESNLDTLLAILEVYDQTDEHKSTWTAPRPVRVTTRPQSLPVSLCRPDDRTGRTECDTPERRVAWKLAPGSYILEVPATADTASVRLAFRVEPAAIDRRAELALHIDVPRIRAVPENFVYVPAGNFLFGFGQNRTVEPTRRLYETLPLHERSSHAYLIASHETTYDQWIEFLRAQPIATRRALLDQGGEPTGRIAVQLRATGPDADQFEFMLRIGPTAEYRVGLGEPVQYRGRADHKIQRWEQFPVTNISAQEARAYTDWLSRTGAVAGARLCTETEWERAGRGADSRLYPGGNTLATDDANFADTHGREDDQFGFDQVGLRSLAATSPFGVHDLAGNAREITRAIMNRADLPTVFRSGSFFHNRVNHQLPNRNAVKADQRDALVGFRVCADATTRQRP